MGEQFIIDFFRSACFGSTRKYRGGFYWTEAQFAAVKRFILATRTGDEPMRHISQWTN